MTLLNMLCTFLDDVMSSHNGTNGAELDDVMFGLFRQLMTSPRAPGTKSAIHNWLDSYWDFTILFLTFGLLFPAHQ